MDPRDWDGREHGIMPDSNDIVTQMEIEAFRPGYQDFDSQKSEICSLIFVVPILRACYQAPRRIKSRGLQFYTTFYDTVRTFLVDLRMSWSNFRNDVKIQHLGIKSTYDIYRFMTSCKSVITFTDKRDTQLQSREERKRTIIIPRPREWNICNVDHKSMTFCL